MSQEFEPPDEWSLEEREYAFLLTFIEVQSQSLDTFTSTLASIVIALAVAGLALEGLISDICLLLSVAVAFIGFILYYRERKLLFNLVDDANETYILKYHKESSSSENIVPEAQEETP